ncbi:MAG: O-antigen ligase family protein, partial [Chloroflexi bacterium]|nr:O-antigen ligase family protein [Chloroflexota bacterium]
MSKQHLMLLVAFSLLLPLVVLGSTVDSSLFVLVALIVMLFVSIGAILRPGFALLLVFFGAGLPSVLIPLPDHTMRLIEPALLLCILVIILRHPYLKLRLPHLLALLFVVIAIISFVHVPEVSTDLNAYAADKRLYEVLLMCVAFFCGAFLMNYVKNASSFLVAILLCNIPLYLIALVQALNVRLSSPFEVSGAQNPLISGGRLWGPTDGPVIFGMYLINLFVIALVCWLLGEHRRDRFIGAAMTIVTALAIVGSGTRSAVIAAVAICMISFTILRRFKLLCIMTILASIMIVAFFNRILPLFTHDPYSASNRVFLWGVAIKLIIAHPWIGIGLQQFHFYYSQLIVSAEAELGPHGIQPHEQYLEWAMESGILWLIVGVLLLLSITIACWRAYKIASHSQRSLPLVTLLALLANIMIGFLDVPLDRTEGAVVLFLLAGMALTYTERIRWKQPTLSPTPTYPPQRKHSAELPFTSQRTPSALSPAPTSNSLRNQWVLSPQATKPTGSSKKFLRSAAGAEKPTKEQSKENVSRDTSPSIQKTGRSITIQLVCWALAIPIIFPVTTLLTRYLGPIQYGEYSFTLPFLAICALLSGTGMDPLIIRQLSQQPRIYWSETLSYATGSRLISTIFSASVISLVAFALPLSAEQRNLLLLGTISLLFSFSYNGLRSIYSHGFRAEQRIGILISLETANRVTTALLVALIVLLRLSLL